MGPSNSTVECARVLSEVNRCPRDLVLWRSIGQRTSERRSMRGGGGGGAHMCRMAAQSESGERQNVGAV